MWSDFNFATNWLAGHPCLLHGILDSKKIFQMKVSIILVNYNTKEMTKACIDSIFEKTKGIEFEVILVDNDSHDGSQEVFANDRRITFVEAGGNIGFGRANNMGLTKATGEYIFFLNTDTLLVNNAVKLFYDFCESSKDKKIGGVGCLLQNADGQRIHSFAPFPTLGRELRDFFIAPIYKKFRWAYHRYDTTRDDTKKDWFYVDYATGADLFVSRKVIDEYGGFDPDFFMYFEETEMQHRWSRAGYPSTIIKTPNIIHLEGGSVKIGQLKFNHRQFLFGLRSKNLYFKKTQGLISYILYRIINVLNIYVAKHHHFKKEEMKEVYRCIFTLK